MTENNSLHTLLNSKRTILSIKDANSLANAKNGFCLSTIYKNSNTKLLWQCNKGHQWEARYNSIQQGHWCFKCRKLDIHEMKIIALDKKGDCLSSEYQNNKSKLMWKCEKGHEWQATPANIKKGHWCPKCAGQHTYTIKDLRTIANKRGGELLSNKRGNSKTKLKWKCKMGHIWTGITGQVVAGRWCPECSKGLGERICRTYFEEIFKDKFPTKYPNWLKTEEGKQLELDGYCENKNIAFEHNGRQHYEIDGLFTKNNDDLAKRKSYDKIKEKLCKENGVKLVVIPEIGSLLKIENLKVFIKESLNSQQIECPSELESTNICLNKAYYTNNDDLVQELKNIAKKNEGILLSESYLGWKNKLLWKCKEGHQWHASPNKIRNAKTWCPICVGKNKNIKDMQILALRKKGKCLSSNYRGKREKLLWECNENHKFKISPDSLIQGHWCQICAKNQKKTIDDMKEIAKSRNGFCHSINYTNAKQYLSWQCKEGHQWEAPYSRILKSWCPKCAGNAKLSIKDAQRIAQEKAGKCISTEYSNSNDSLEWQCSRGHTWKASYAQIRRNTWCPKCAGNGKLSIQTMTNLAKAKGGECLSKLYVNNKTGLSWKCKYGHVWNATPDKIKNRNQWTL